MRRFWDERGYIVTESELKAEFEALKSEQPNEYSYNFEEFVLNCTDKNGTLTEI